MNYYSWWVKTRQKVPSWKALLEFWCVKTRQRFPWIGRNTVAGTGGLVTLDAVLRGSLRRQKGVSTPLRFLLRGLGVQKHETAGAGSERSRALNQLELRQASCKEL